MSAEAAMRLSPHLQQLAQSLGEVLAEIAGEDVAFVLVIQAGHVAQYIANVQRKDGVAVLEDLLARWKAGAADLPAQFNPDIPKGPLQ